jgi:hypothetical protein
MIVVVAISFAMFACRDRVRNHFGKYFVQGYRYRRGETDYNDYGQPFYGGDEWTATNGSGRWAVELDKRDFDLISDALPFGRL